MTTWPQLKFDSWLTGIIGVDVYQMRLPEKNRTIDAEANSRTLQRLKRQPIFVYSKTDATQIEQIIYLEEMGFHLIDTNIGFVKSIGITEKRGVDKAIRLATPDDQKGVREVASCSFIFFSISFGSANPK